jgi:hypothetical protein
VEFRRGLIEGCERDLAWARLAIYELTNAALLPIIAHLIALAIEMPGGEFVESLAFFCFRQQTLSPIRPLIQAVTAELRMNMAADVATLRNELRERGDADLADRLTGIQDLAP